MLQFIRSKAGSFVVKILFVLLILSFGIWGIGDFLRQSPREGSLATIGKADIKAEDLQLAIRNQAARYQSATGQTLDQAQIKAMGLPQRMLGALVNQATIDQESAHQHLAVGDEQLATVIRKTFVDDKGQFDRARYEQFLAANRLSENALRDEIRRQTLLTAVQAAATAPAALTDLLYRLRGERRVADYVIIPPSAIANLAAPTGAELKAYYEAHRDAFTAPEYRGFTALVLHPEDVGRSMKPDEAKLKAAYDQRKDEFTVPERRHLWQMLLPDEKTADDAVAALGANGDFMAAAQRLAKQAAGTVDLGTVAKGELPAELADPAFALPLNGVSKPIHTPLGWHVLKVVGILPAGTKSYEEARPQLLREQQGDQLYDLSNQVQDAVAGGADFAAIAKQFGLTPYVVAAVDKDGKDPSGQPVKDMPAGPDMLKTAFATDAGSTSQMQQYQGETFFILRTDKVTPPTLKPLASVEDQVRAAWTEDRRQSALADRAKAMAAEIAAGKTLAQAAAPLNLKVQTSSAFTRSGKQSELALPAPVVATLFAGKVGAVATGPGLTGEIVAQLKSVQPADPAGSKQAQATEAPALTRDLADELTQQYVEALHRLYPVGYHPDRLNAFLQAE